MRPSGHKGFTLIEIAIVMVIIGLLTGGGISFLKVLTERKARNDNLEYLQQAKEAILSFANINGRLPWPDTDNDGTGTDSPCALNATCAGFLPFTDLNIAPTDAYQRSVKYEISNDPRSLGTNRGTTCSSLRAWPPPPPPPVRRPLLIDMGSPAFIVAAILISGGPMDADGAGVALDRHFDAIAGVGGGNNITGTPNYIRSSPTNTFDDVVVFIGGYELNSKMACTAADVCSGTGFIVQNGSGVTLYNKRNGILPCNTWNTNNTIPVFPTDFYDIFTDSGCTAAWPLPNTTRTITYSQQEGIDVDRNCLTGFNNGNMVDR